METKSLVSFKMELNGRHYSFNMEAGAPLGEAYDMAFQVLQKIVDHAQEAAKKVERSEDNVIEEPEEIGDIPEDSVDKQEDIAEAS